MTNLNEIKLEFSFIKLIINWLNCLSTLKLKTIIFPAFILIHFSLPAQQNNLNHPNVKKITVDSVIQTSNYTYVKGTTDLNSKDWYALPKKEIEINKNYYFYNPVEMRNFKSTELKRIFPLVMFINDLINPDELKSEINTSQKNKIEKKQVILPPEKGISVAELFNNREKYNNKIIRLKGEVTKFNSGIMNRNWIHLKDYSLESEGFDFTATTQMEANVGDVIILEGKIVLNKDFSSGYFYEVLMEDCKIIH